MLDLDDLETLFVIVAFLFQGLLITHFTLRKWHFDLAMRYGRIVYALGIPAAGVSIFLALNNTNWSFWLGGILYLVWAGYGYTVEYIRRIQWRSPPYWPVLGPYVTLYLATVMFYWWPLALIYKPLWYLYGALFLVSTFLNVTSHHSKEPLILKEESQ
jgi:hypothetical protein